MIVYYVHHHGSGHVHRASVVAGACATPVVGVSSRPAPSGWTGEWITIADDASGVDPRRADVTAGGTLHWVPRRHAGLRERTAALSSVLSRPQVRLLVSDVSVEVAVLARLHGVPVAVVTQPGSRTDRPHRTAFDLADRVVAPWPALLPQPHLPAHTVHVGGLSRFDDRPPPPPATEPRVLLLCGSGGSDAAGGGVRDAASATPGWEWEIAGAPAAAGSDPPNLHRPGWVDDVWGALARACVVVTHAGLNALAEVAAARRPAVVIPEDRPHGEQRATARMLDDAGIAVVADRWPSAGEWPALLERAVALGGDGWSRWSDGKGAARAAAVLDDLAERS